MSPPVLPSVVHMPPRGRYLADEVGVLAGVSGYAIGQWARRGYIRSSVSEGRPRVYSFQDVAEAIIVHELLERGVKHADVLRAVRALHDVYGDSPLTHAPLATAGAGGKGSRLYFRQNGEMYDVGGDQPWQQVLRPEHLEEVRRLLRRGGWAARELPELEHVEVDPDRLSGRPTIRGRRIAAQDVADMAATMDVDDLIEDYDLTLDEVRDARTWWHEAKRLSSRPGGRAATG